MCGVVPRRRGATGAGDRLHPGRGRRPAPRPRCVEEGPTSGARRADHENSRIYYETVPAPKELRAPPAVKTMGPEAPLCLIADAEPVPLSAPTADDEALARQLAASFEEDGSGPPPPAYEAAAPSSTTALSDEELARRLHEERGSAEASWNENSKMRSVTRC